MIWPLRCLALLSLFAGVVGYKEIFERHFSREKLVLPETVFERVIEPLKHSPVAAAFGVAAVAIGLFAAWKFYWNTKSDPLPAKLGALATTMRNKFYFDELYEATVIRAHDFLTAVADWIDRWIVEGFCIGLVRGGTDLTGRALRLVQTGNLQTYAFLFVLGVAAVLWFVLGK